jgi:hypothetical protein
VTYEGTTTNVTSTLWGEQFTNATWGVTQASHIENVVSAQPRFNFYRGNGTLSSFVLSVPPVDSNHLIVWVNGTVTAPSSVNTSVASPSFTIAAPAGNNLLVAALIQTNNPD